jgi:hypothetical protein
MKFRIIKETRHDGIVFYTPQVKEKWYNIIWYNLVQYPIGIYPTFMDKQTFLIKDFAYQIIKKYKEQEIKEKSKQIKAREYIYEI